jgi:hypothetical protein
MKNHSRCSLLTDRVVSYNTSRKLGGFNILYKVITLATQIFKADFLSRMEVTMRRFVSIATILVIMLNLTACSGQVSSDQQLNKEGIAPYETSESEQFLLSSFGMEGNAQIIKFHAPEEAMGMNINVYRLNDGSWKSVGGGTISVDEEMEVVDQLAGVFTMELREHFIIDFHITIDDGGRASYTTDPVFLDFEVTASAKGFLQDFQKIEIGKEIPVALMVYNHGTSIDAYSLQDYFKPEKFEGMDLVQAVTITFSDTQEHEVSGASVERKIIHEEDEIAEHMELALLPDPHIYIAGLKTFKEFGSINEGGASLHVAENVLELSLTKGTGTSTGTVGTILTSYKAPLVLCPPTFAHSIYKSTITLCPISPTILGAFFNSFF